MPFLTELRRCYSLIPSTDVLGYCSLVPNGTFQTASRVFLFLCREARLLVLRALPGAVAAALPAWQPVVWTVAALEDARCSASPEQVADEPVQELAAGAPARALVVVELARAAFSLRAAGAAVALLWVLPAAA